MSFSINTRDLPKIHTYAQAEAWFNKTRYPERSKKWLPYQRPLRNTRSHHLRIEQRSVHDVPCYDLILYQTPVIRLFKPNDQGEQAVWLQSFNSVSTIQFMWCMGWYDRMTMEDTVGNKLSVPVSTQSRVALDVWDDTFTTKLVLNNGGYVMPDRSAHIPYMRKSSSATHRAKRKQMREDLSMVYDMLEMQYQSFISGIRIDSREGEPFQPRSQRFTLDFVIQEKIRTDGIRSLDPDDMTHLMTFASNTCHDIAQSIVNRRADAFEYPAFDFTPYEHGDWHQRSRGYDVRLERDRGLRLNGEAPNDGNLVSEHTPEVQACLTPTWDDIKKAIDLEFQHIAQLKSGDTYKPYPQFMFKLPRKLWGVDRSMGVRDALGQDTYSQLTNHKGKVY